MRKPSVKASLVALFIFVGICAIMFYVMPLVGCVDDSPAVPNIFLASLRQRNDDSIEVRVGYYGICVYMEKQMACYGTGIPNAKNLVSKEIAIRFGSTETAADSLITLAFKIQSIWQHALATGGVAFFLGTLSFCAWAVTSRKKPSQVPIWKIMTEIFLWPASACTLAAALSVQQTEGVLKFVRSQMTNSAVQISPGVTMIVLHWMAFGFSALFHMGVIWVFVQPLLKKKKVEDDSDDDSDSDSDSDDD